jgi:hypothetical protein
MNGDVQSVLECIHKDKTLNEYKTIFLDPPIVIAAEKNKPEIVKALLDVGANVSHCSYKMGELPIYIAAQSKDRRVFDTLVRYGYKTCCRQRAKDKALMSLLVAKRLDLFKDLVEVFSTHIPTFFRTRISAHYPLHELCINNECGTVFHLLSKYTRNELNIDGDNSKNTLPLCPIQNSITLYKGEIVLNEYERNWRDMIKHPEQELIWCLTCNPCIIYSPYAFFRPKDQIIIKLIELGYFSTKSLEYDNIHDEGSFLLRTAYRLKKYYCVDKIEEVAFKESDIITPTLSLSYAVHYDADEERIKHLIQKGAKFQLPSSFLSPFGSDVLAPIFIISMKPQMYTILQHFYKTFFAKTNIKYTVGGVFKTPFDGLVDLYLHQTAVASCNIKALTSTLNILYAAGEYFAKERTVAIGRIVEYAKIVADNGIDQNHQIKLKICPHRGPGETSWFSPIIDDLVRNSPYMPSLFEICRCVIRNSMLHNTNRNLFTTYTQLPNYKNINKFMVYSPLVFNQV